MLQVSLTARMGWQCEEASFLLRFSGGWIVKAFVKDCGFTAPGGDSVWPKHCWTHFHLNLGGIKGAVSSTHWCEKLVRREICPLLLCLFPSYPLHLPKYFLVTRAVYIC